MPARLLIINGKNGKERRIHVETYYDRAMQALYAFSLDPIAESWGDRKSFAYRKGRSAFDLNEYIKDAFSGEDAPEWVVRIDVQRCYETISHNWILSHIPLAPKVLREFLSAGYIFAGKLFPANVGIGIGCSVSPIIANMALDGLQEYIFNHLYPNGGEIDYANGNMIRYADDIIVSARDEDTAKKIKAIVKNFLEERGLEMSSEKTRIFNINDGFTFMSRTYSKRGNQLYARPSDQAIMRFMNSMRETIENYTGSQKSLIDKVNKKIDGWVTYHKVSEAEDAFRKMDVYISALLLELCEKKHPKWEREKILEKYWYVDANGRHHYALPDKKEIGVKFLADTLTVRCELSKTGRSGPSFSMRPQQTRCIRITILVESPCVSSSTVAVIVGCGSTEKQVIFLFERKEYSAGAVKYSFWFSEFRKTVALLAEGKTEEEIRRLSAEENLFAARTPARGKMICSEVIRRVNGLDADFIPVFIGSDLPTQKLFNLTAIMARDTLFFDLVYEVIREKLILGLDTLSDADVRVFFRDKQQQSDKVAGWTDYTLQRLGSSYKSMLTEADILVRGKTEYRILRPILVPEFRDWLNGHGMAAVVRALEGTTS